MNGRERKKERERGRESEKRGEKRKRRNKSGTDEESVGLVRKVRTDF